MNTATQLKVIHFFCFILSVFHFISIPLVIAFSLITRCLQRDLSVQRDPSVPSAPTKTKTNHNPELQQLNQEMPGTTKHISANALQQDNLGIEHDSSTLFVPVQTTPTPSTGTNLNQVLATPGTTKGTRANTHTKVNTSHFISL